MPAPTIYVIAGCNGAGKTTFAKEFWPHEIKCLRFYNADEIARGLSLSDRLATAAAKGHALDLCQELFLADGARSDEEAAGVLILAARAQRHFISYQLKLR
jgi:predicted ABC-type ATPase